MNPKNEIILSILALSETPLTAREIYNAMEASERGHFCNIEHVARTLDVIKRSQKEVEQAEPKIVDGFKRITWQINKKGREQLNQHRQNQPETQEEPEVMSKNTENVDTSIEHVQETEETIQEVIEVTPEFALNEGIRLITDAFKSLTDLPEPVTITHKSEKLKVLEHFEQFARPMNQDFAVVLADIRQDLKKLQDAA